MPNSTDTAAAGRVLDGFLDREGLSRELDRSTRTIARYEEMGLPVIRRGRMVLYDVEKVRAWLRGEPPAPRRGRRPRVKKGQAAEARA